MITLGYEDPVLMPSMEVYNTDLMKAYIAGVKEQYDNARLDMKDFTKLYGDFYSPIAGDTLNYYNMTIGGANKLIDDMLAQGIDPYKNPQARAAIARYIASVPTGTLNAMKLNAEARKLYDLNKAKMIADGTYIPGMEDETLRQLGLDNFQTVGPNGEVRIWDRLSPDKGMSLLELTSPEFHKFGQDEPLGQSTGHGKLNQFYHMYGISDANKQAATDASIEALQHTPQGRYYLKQAADRAAINGTTLKDEITKDIQKANAEYLQPKEVKDDVALSVWQTNQSTKASRSSGGGGNGGSGDKEKGAYSHYTNILFSSIGKAGVLKGLTLSQIQSAVSKSGKSIWNHNKVENSYVSVSKSVEKTELKQMLGRMYSKEAIDNYYAYGATGYTKQQADAKTQQLGQFLEDLKKGKCEVSAKHNGKAGVVSMKSGHTSQFEEYTIRVRYYDNPDSDNKKLQAASTYTFLYKEAEYDVNEDGNYTFTDNYAPEATAGNSRISTFIAGQTGNPTVSNVNK